MAILQDKRLFNQTLNNPFYMASELVHKNLQSHLKWAFNNAFG